MTLVAGFKCFGGVVLCADTQENAEDLKLWAEKLFYYNNEWCQAGFGGSGSSWIVDRLLERIGQEMDDRRCDNLRDVTNCIRFGLQEVYDKEIRLHPDKDEDKRSELLIAVRPKMQQEVTMFRTNGPVMSEVVGLGYQVVGVGEVVSYIAQNLYRHSLPISQGVTLAIHLVNLAKKYVDSVGGDTNVLILTSDGRIGWESTELSERKEKFFEEFNEALKHIILLCPDTSVPGKWVSSAIDAFATRIKALREQYFAKESEEATIQSLLDWTQYGRRQVYRRFPQGYGHVITERIKEVMREIAPEPEVMDGQEDA